MESGQKAGNKVSELLEKLNRDIKDDVEFDELWGQINETQPFSTLTEQIVALEQQVEGMQKAIDKLKKHRHIQTGEAVTEM